MDFKTYILIATLRYLCSFGTWNIWGSEKGLASALYCSPPVPRFASQHCLSSPEQTLTPLPSVCVCK